MQFCEKILGSVQRFLRFGWLFLIGVRSVGLQEAIGKGMVLWIDLEPAFQFWIFKEFFQVCLWPFSAAFSLQGLGLYSWLCSEHIRLRKFNKIQWINGFAYLIFLRSFWIFFKCIFVQSCQIKPNLAILGCARDIEPLRRVCSAQKDLKTLF